MALILPAARAGTAYRVGGRNGANRMRTLARSDRWPPVWVVALAATLLAGFWIAGLALAGALGARALKQAINLTGDWSIYLLLVTLAVTPARHILAAPRLSLARRTLGLAAFGYAALHLVLYAFDLDLDLRRVASEIVLRLYLTIGAVALLGLVALAATSCDGAVRRLGAARWNRLHRSVYACALLSVVHFLLRSPTDTFEPMLIAGLLAWLAGYRLLRRRGDVGPDAARGARGHGGSADGARRDRLARGGDRRSIPWRILAAHLDVAYGLRPAWWVLIAGLAAAALAGLRQLRPQRPSARMSASSAASGAMRGQSPS